MLISSDFSCIVNIHSPIRKLHYVLNNFIFSELFRRKKDKASDLSRLVAEMIKNTGNVETQWTYVMELRKKVASQRIVSQVRYYQFTKRKGMQLNVNHTEELNC